MSGSGTTAHEFVEWLKGPSPCFVLTWPSRCYSLCISFKVALSGRLSYPPGSAPGKFQAQTLWVWPFSPVPDAPQPGFSPCVSLKPPGLPWNRVSCGFTCYLPRAQSCFSNLPLDLPILQAKNTPDIFEGLLGLELLSWREWVSLKIKAGVAAVTSWGQPPQSHLVTSSRPGCWLSWCPSWTLSSWRLGIRAESSLCPTQPGT